LGEKVFTSDFQTIHKLSRDPHSFHLVLAAPQNHFQLDEASQPFDLVHVDPGLPGLV